jgi:aminoglycoside 3-N-acetyltransferase
MLHGSVKAVGRVLGGPNVILQALLDGLTPEGTLMMYVGWEDIPDYVQDMPPEHQRIYYEESPPFDPLLARAVREHGILAEFLRTWKGAYRSAHPEASMSAVGANAQWLTADHPMRYGYGEGSPLAKLCKIGGGVLLLGAPLYTITLLHHAEHLANIPNKRVVRYRCPILENGHTVWLDMEDFDTGEPHYDYRFEDIAGDYLATGKARSGLVGNAQSYLFDAADLVQFAVNWLEERFGG